MERNKSCINWAEQKATVNSEEKVKQIQDLLWEEISFYTFV